MKQIIEKALYVLVGNKPVPARDLKEIKESDLVAEVKVLIDEKSNETISIDMYIPNENWIKYSDYLKQSNI